MGIIDYMGSNRYNKGGLYFNCMRYIRILVSTSPPFFLEARQVIHTSLEFLIQLSILNVVLDRTLGLISGFTAY